MSPPHTPSPPPAPAAHNASGQNNALAFWLLIMAIFVGIMVMSGGITRLTNSGLSMVEWRPLIGILPPFSEAEWLRIFTLYQSSPEFNHINSDMNISGFKVIFFWEYFHRVWGRLLGLAFFLPFLFFWGRRKIPRGYLLPLIGLLCLGGIQGVIGWWMVKSGLVDNPAISQYRLATHLTMALTIYSLLIWTGLNLLHRPAGLPRFAHAGIIALVALTIIAGAFVAGMDAGLLYNEYPLMGDTLVPFEYGESGFLDPFENPASAQFHHRWLAMLAMLAVFGLWVKAFRAGLKKRSYVMAGLICYQFSLGIVTLLLGVPVWAGLLHQSGALLLLGSVIIVIHGLEPSS